jgi:hypothetical protein
MAQAGVGGSYNNPLKKFKYATSPPVGSSFEYHTDVCRLVFLGEQSGMYKVVRKSRIIVLNKDYS